MNWLPALTDDCFHGVLRVIREERGVRFARMTPAQLAYFERKEAWGIRARCAAGVTLELHTDSPWLDIKFEILSSCRQFFGIDVEIDGVLSHAVRVDEHQGAYEGRLFELPPGKPRHVRVHLPYTAEIRLLEVGLSEAALVKAEPPRPYRLLALGDSITQGMEAHSPFSSYPVQLARLLNAELLNQGVGGHIFDAAALDANVGFCPDLVTVAYGTNDWGQKDAEQLRRDVRDYLANLRTMFPAQRTRIAVLSPLWRAGGSEKKHGASLLDFSCVVLEEAARVPGTVAIDGLTLVPNQPWYFADGTHPTDGGFLHYALNLYAALMRRQEERTGGAVV